MTKAGLQQFVILPPHGITADTLGTTTTQATSFLLALETMKAVGKQAHASPPAKGIPAGVRVIDSIHENGAKLVESSPEGVAKLRASEPGLRIVPVVWHRTAIVRWTAVDGVAALGAKKAATIEVRVVSRADQRPIAGVEVVAFTDFAARVGAQAKTNAKGVARLALGAAKPKVERLYLYSRLGFWNGLMKNATLQSGMVVALRPIDLTYTDCLRHFYGNPALGSGAGVTVGVIDTGIAAHPDLVVAGGENTVPGEDPGDFGDNGAGHGTHVAGIIAARGTPPTGVRGLAAGVKLRSYRVFPAGSERASNFAIAKAIDRAVADGCDLVNMSLGGGPPDEVTHSAIGHARAHGTLVIAANGNDSRQPVSSPAADSLCLAVSAMGRVGTFPTDSTEVGDVAPPRGKDKKDFVAEFSNVGPETDLTGPGVGVISTFPGGYAVLDGTSMACPAATGAAAKLLAGMPAILGMARKEERSDAMAHAVLSAARPRAFGPAYEGSGLL